MPNNVNMRRAEETYPSPSLNASPMYFYFGRKGTGRAIKPSLGKSQLIETSYADGFRYLGGGCY